MRLYVYMRVQRGVVSCSLHSPRPLSPLKWQFAFFSSIFQTRLTYARLCAPKTSFTPRTTTTTNSTAAPAPPPVRIIFHACPR